MAANRAAAQQGSPAVIWVEHGRWGTRLPTHGVACEHRSVYRWRSCADCGKPATRHRKISVRGLCRTCGKRRQVAALDQMRAKSGPAWERFKEGYAQALTRL